MKLIKELINKPINENSQRELELDEPNLNVESEKFHRALTAPKYGKLFVRKPETFDRVESHAKDYDSFTIEELWDIVDPETFSNLEFTEKEVYGGVFNRPLKKFSPDFTKKGLTAFIMTNSDGMFVVRTEGADYARYVAFVSEDEPE